MPIHTHGRAFAFRGRGFQSGASDELQALQARMAVAADDDVVVHGDPHRPRRLDDGARHVDVGAGRGRIPRRVVVDQPVKLRKLLYFNRIYNGANEVVPVSGVCNSRQFGTIPV